MSLAPNDNTNDTGVPASERVHIDVVDASFAPLTPRGEYRRLTRGDFGPSVDSSQTFPQNSTYSTLSKLVDNIQDLPYCTGDTNNDDQSTALSSSGNLVISPELAAAVANVPQQQRCLASVKYFTNKILKEQKQSDKRRVRLPKYGQPESTYDVTYTKLAPLERAKRHLDKARQMYLSGRSLISMGVEGARTNAFHINRGRALQYNVQLDNKQLPRLKSSSALYNLWMGYKYIREYEMNPLPPLMPDGTVNMERVQQDEVYNFIMGTFRLEPNRLGIGAEARRIWRDHNVLDSNYYYSMNVDLPDDAEEESAISMNNDNNNTRTNDAYSHLYASVPPTAPRGPERVQALLGYIDDAAAAAMSLSGQQSMPTNENANENNNNSPTPGTLQELPESDNLSVLGYPNLSQWTDVAKALKNIHDNFVPPRVILMQEASTTTITITRPIDPPPPLAYPPYASIDAPYPEPNGWPFDTIDKPSADYIPVFFPTGESLHPSGRGPPYKYMGDAHPPLGPPDSRIVPQQWDAREAAEILSSYRGRLQQQASAMALTTRALESETLGSENDAYEPPHIPLQYWDRGKLVYDYIRVPSTEYTNISQPTTTIVGGRVMDEYQDPNRLQYGVDRHMYMTNALPPQQRITQISQAQQLHVSNLYPLGIKTLDIPNPTQLNQLPSTRDQQIRMLMHALFLLSAPLNAWMKANLPERLWLHEPPLTSRDPGSLSFGQNWPGEGYYQRTNANMIDPTRKGWRGYFNVFSLAPEGGIRGRPFIPPGTVASMEYDTQEEEEEEQHELGGDELTTPASSPPPDNNTTTEKGGKDLQRPRQQRAKFLPADYRTNGVPIGPFLLDPAFGTPNHIPGSTYSYTASSQEIPMVWVIRTNQMTVMNENTWGLDFYF